MNRVSDDLLLQEFERTEDYIHTCADAIDVKAGQILAAAAFLALQPAVLLIAPNIPASVFIAQIFSFLVLLAAAIFAHIVLQVGDYPSPVVTEAWRDSVIVHRNNAATEEDVSRTILWGMVSFARERVMQGQLLNGKKIKKLQWARGLTTASFIINFLIICGIMISRFF
jgi:hypothetical protein